MIPGSAGSSGGKLPPEETCAGHAQNTKQAMAHISQTRICVCRHFVAKCIWNRSGKYGLTNLYFATKGAIPPLLLSIQLVKCESQTAKYRLSISYLGAKGNIESRGNLGIGSGGTTELATHPPEVWV